MSDGHVKLPAEDDSKKHMHSTSRFSHQSASSKESIKAPPPSFVSDLSTTNIKNLDSETLKQKCKEIDASRRATYPYRARVHDETKIMKKMNTAPKPHDYFGFIFSKHSPRPRNTTYYTLPYLPQPNKRQKVLLPTPEIPPGVVLPLKASTLGLFPLSTVKVRWAASPRNTLYKPSDVYQILSRIGPIEKVYGLSPNSALVIFSELEHALIAVRCHEVGVPFDPINVSWFEPRMYNYGFYRKYQRTNELYRTTNSVKAFEKEIKKDSIRESLLKKPIKT